MSTLTSDLQTSVNASINNYTEPENEQDAAEESDLSLPDLEPIMTEEPDFDDELPPYIPIWMRNIRSTPIVGSVSESEEKDWDDDCEMEPQSRAETSHGRNIEHVSLFKVGGRQIAFSSKNGNKTIGISKNPENLNSLQTSSEVGVEHWISNTKPQDVSKQSLKAMIQPTLGKELTQIQKDRLETLLLKYSILFQPKTGLTNLISHKIENS